MKKFFVVLTLIFIMAPAIAVSDSKESNDAVIDKKTSIQSEQENKSVLNEKSYFKSYLKKLEKKLKSNWNPPKSKKTKIVKILFKIHKDGSVSDISISKSSGSDLVDIAAINAVNASLPLSPLPIEYTGDNIEILFTFDYKVFPGNISTKKKSLKAYKKAQKELILKNWKWKDEKAEEKKTVEVSFLINKKGKAYDIEILKSSGDEVFDKRVIETIKTTKYDSHENFYIYRPVKMKLKFGTH